jgi:tRNA nucleotidyltransferase (CCA-adding enzyme)
MIITKPQIDTLARINSLGHEHSVKVFLVGGVIRDTLLGKSSLDFDLMVEGDGIKFGRYLASQMSLDIKEHPAFMTAKLSGFGPELTEVDIATAREEYYPAPGALPVVKASTIESDLGRRDFTINALLAPLGEFLQKCTEAGDIRSVLIDRFGGLQDLESRTIRFLHTGSFSDDPTRIFRGARYAARLVGKFETVTYDTALKLVGDGGIQSISYYRIGNELRWILAESESRVALQILKDLGVFKAINFGQSPDMAQVVSILKECCDKAIHHGLEYARMEVPVFMFLMTPSLSENKRDELFLNWGFGKRGVERARSALNQMGIRSTI